MVNIERTNKQAMVNKTENRKLQNEKINTNKNWDKLSFVGKVSSSILELKGRQVLLITKTRLALILTVELKRRVSLHISIRLTLIFI